MTIRSRMSHLAGKARHLHEQGLSREEIARRLSVSYRTACKLLAGLPAADKSKRVVERAPTHRYRKSIDADAERLLAATPADTRPLSARLMGDPLPGRSALDRRRI